MEKQAEEEKPIMGTGRILVMDDEGAVRETASAMLYSLGYEVTSAINGAEAAKLYKEAMETVHPFDVVILDLTVPGSMGGKETIKKLKEMDPEVNAIVSSGYSNDPIMGNFEEYGFKDVIAKPYKVKELSEALHRVIAGNA